MTLAYVDAVTDEVLDTVTLTDGQLSYTTGSARGLFAGRQAQFGWSDEQAFTELTGWSNGYLALRPTL